MMHPFATFTLVVSALALPSTLAQQGGAARQTDARTETVYVSVLDSDGKPVKGIPASDFIVREDGAIREVLKAGAATEPLTISLLVDDSQASEPAIQQIRDGLTAFVDRLQGHAEIALATVGERPTPVVDYTANAAELKKAIGRIFARPGSGSYLLDALVDVSRGLQKREAKRPTIVVLTIEAVEFSNRHYEPVLEELKKSGAALHVLAVGTPTNARTDEERNRNMVIAEGTERTGGRRDQLLSVMAIPERLKQLADELANQYVVTYSRPESLIPPEKLSVSVKQPGLTVRARTRTNAGR